MQPDPFAPTDVRAKLPAQPGLVRSNTDPRTVLIYCARSPRWDRHALARRGAGYWYCEVCYKRVRVLR